MHSFGTLLSTRSPYPTILSPHTHVLPSARVRSTVDGKRCSFPISFGGQLMYDCIFLGGTPQVRREREGHTMSDEYYSFGNQLCEMIEHAY